MNVDVPDNNTTGTGGSDGYFTLTSGTTVGFYPSAQCWITKPDDTLPQLCLITELNSTNKLGLLFIPEGINDPKLATGAVKYPSYGRSDLSAYTAGSKLAMPAQVVRVYQPAFDPLIKI